jgi:hypothetical protein
MSLSRALSILLIFGVFLLGMDADARRRRKKPLPPWAVVEKPKKKKKKKVRRRRGRRGSKRKARAKKTADAKAAAKAYAAGKKMFKDKDYVGALAAFEKAYKLKPHFLVQCNIARCYERISKMVDAVEHYRQCLKEGANEKPKVVQRVREALVKVEARVTWVEINSSGKGGIVFVDGKEAGPAPIKVPLNPGSAVVEVRREGATPAKVMVVARGGESKTFDLVPEDLPPQRPPPPKVITVVKKEESRGLHQAWLWTSAGVTVALAATATVFGVLALKSKGDYEDNPTRDGYHQASDRRMVTNILWGATAAAAGASTLLFFYTDFGGKKETDKGRDLSFGVGVRGTF